MKSRHLAFVSVLAAAATILPAVGDMTTLWPQVGIGLQDAQDLNPNSGVVEVVSGDGRAAQFTHYQYGTTIRATGIHSDILEMWLGDPNCGQPNLSLRHNGSNQGAIIQARNAADTAGLMLDFGDNARPRIRCEQVGAPDSVLAIENSQSNGSLAFATRVDGVTADRVTIANDGTVGIASLDPSAMVRTDANRQLVSGGSCTDLVDISDISTITGWSAVTVKEIWMRLTNGQATVFWGLAGTSNATTVSFTLPVTARAGTVPQFCALTANNTNGGVLQTTPGRARMNADDNTVVCFTDCGTGAWSPEQTKATFGSLTFEIGE